ncbi:FAD-dependent monooxygenase [Dyella mobilis]|uniref:FAD-dependent monooxygenase n=1 Tax=Dyella mobilis TaxID=1849582 RepID=A0ABS2KD76_9GAMM|nr:FAD-dependent monooxygenase [Dyella mobilis]MBM7129044.1 FAD-dependent monooxygenase [Dyella mobilis]
MPKRILISGASVAGPALAFWLHRYGFDVTVVERAPTIRPGGYAVDFRGTATHVLDCMGLTAAVKQCETRTGAIAMVDERGDTLAQLPDGFTSGDIEILRGDLVKLLYDATREDVAYVFGDSISALTQTSEGVDVTFTSGKRGRFDLVVGADGLHSNTRALAFRNEAEILHEMGYYLAIFTVPDYLGLHDQGRYYTQLGKRVGYFGSKNDGSAKASFYFASSYLDRTDSDPLRRDPAAQKQLLRDIFSDVKWEAPRLLAHLDQASDLYFDSLSQIRMDRWSDGRIVLLGDAACCASPLAGMGTSIAITGAYTLAGELKKAGDDYATAFANYEATLRPFVAQAQKMGQGSVEWFVPRSRLRLWFSRKLWSWMPKATLKELMIDQPNKVASIAPLRDYT